MIAGDGSVDKKGKSKLVVPSPLSSGSSAITASSDESSALSSSSSSDMGGEFSRILRPSLSVTTSTNSSYYSFASGGEDAGEYFDGRLAKAISQSRSDATDRTPLAAARADPFNKTNPSPLATPRALSQFEMPKAIAVLQGANDGKSSNRDSLAFVGGGGGGINSRPASVLVQRPTMYKRASRSLVDLQAAAKRQEVEQIVREEEEEQEREQRRRRSMRRSVVVGSSNGGDDSLEGYRASMHLHHLRNEGLGPMAEEETLPNRDALGITKASIAPKEASYSQDGPRIGVHGGEDPNYAGTGGSSVAGSSSVVSGAAGSNVMNPSTTTTWKDATGAPGVLEGRQHQKNNRISMAPAYEASLNPLPPLRRRRSMPTYNESTPPPPYPSFAPHPYGLHASLKILPREDEGREVLPGYSNAIFLKAIMPLKMEFSAPGVQAKDRKWKRVLVVLEGTMLKVYRAPTGPGGVSAIEQWWENKVGAGDVALGPPPAIPAAGSAGTGRAAIAVPAKKEERNREEEKVNQQYLQATVHDELRVDEGQGLSQAAASTASLAGSVAAQRHGKEHRQHHHHHHQPQATQVAITKSALNLAVHLLKPGSRHIRRNSDTGPPSPTAAFRAPDGIPRSSLNLPRPGTSTPTSSTFSSSSRSHSPMPSSSSSVTPHGSRSHSPMPSGSSSRLTVPSSSSSFSSRPPTPTSAGSSRSSRLRTTNTGSRTAYGRACKSEDFEPPKQDLIRCYTMQNAESGLGNDYLKRKNVIRVRLEGEQFLLQAKDVSSVVQWIEGLQAATNIALDLDDRPMPRGPIFPRRRRRRRPNVTPILVNGQAPLATSAVMETYTPTSATAGQPVFRRT
ncbi:hypothetical protein DFP72DRAFT_50834 [Ephemerocybe angulata]|uniref:PH domain-containing protein n=1 Tax=Ephemerocybe angulata TaxID=980116 RepID=A0A8H6HE93_9AGAR|nr:hypothetical protein DFP72DRAFT_50834 [Tulosesus angulatus]